MTYFAPDLHFHERRKNIILQDFLLICYETFGVVHLYETCALI